MTSFSIAFFATLLISLVLHGDGRVQHVLTEEENLEIERQLKIINKPALKTFQTEYGDIIDCIDIYKQPAFDHPLLKNHKIQMRPSSTPSVVQKEAPLQANDATVSGSNGCPSGSIPIRRTTKDDIIRSKFSNAAKINASPADRPGSHYTLVIINMPDLKFHGAKAAIDTANPRIEVGQSSAAQMWIEAGDDQVNSIQVGWVVDPEVYGDNRTHLFTYWTADGYISTGCYDIRCPGFVQVDNSITLGGALSNVSVINGYQFMIRTYVYQDKRTLNWWLEYSVGNKRVGYWPNELFSELINGATYIAYGGRTEHGVNQDSPPMGSGLYPDGSYQHACFFTHLQFVNLFGELVVPSNILIKGVTDKNECYGLDIHGWRKEKGFEFWFGGPGGPCVK